MNIYLESMTKVIFSPMPWKQFIIRCWRQESFVDNETDDRNRTDIYGVLALLDERDKKDRSVIAKKLLELELMNAVEVIEENGNGVVLYKDWP